MAVPVSKVDFRVAQPWQDTFVIQHISDTRMGEAVKC